MARESTWNNNDGLQVHFGPQVSDNFRAGSVHTKGRRKEVAMIVDADDLQSVGTGVHIDQSEIPADAYIVSAVLNTTEAFDNAIEVGTMQLDGTAIDQDGLIATGAHAADIRVVGSGAQIDTTLGQVAYLAVTATTTAPTTGRGELIVTYEI